MPSVKLDLGRYVTVRRRADGTARVLFEVPPRLRPSGWSATIPLPLKDRTGDLKSADELKRIKDDAEELYHKLQRDRRGIIAEPKRSIKKLVETWQGSSEWNDLRPKSKKHYEVYIRPIMAWSESLGHPDPTTLTLAKIKEFLKAFDAQPVTKKNVAKTLRLIMREAVGLNWRADNPVREIKIKVPTTKALIWEREDVDAYVTEARRQGRHSLALIILMEWEIGQRLTDVREFRPGVEYRGGVFAFAQSKTGSEVIIEVSPALRDMLTEAAEGKLFLFENDITGLAFTEHALCHAFNKVRKKVVAAGGRKLLLRWLRHSCIVQLARAGCTIPEIAAVTGHAPSSAASILATYLPRDGEVARKAQEKRGLVKQKEATSQTAVKLSRASRVKK
jgi:hypothetical protein